MATCHDELRKSQNGSACPDHVQNGDYNPMESDDGYSGTDCFAYDTFILICTEVFCTGNCYIRTEVDEEVL